MGKEGGERGGRGRGGWKRGMGGRKGQPISAHDTKRHWWIFQNPLQAVVACTAANEMCVADS